MSIYAVTKYNILMVAVLLLSACGGGGESSSSTSSSGGLTATHPLNDTGITTCGDYAHTDSGTSYDVTGSGSHNNNLTCSTQPTVPTKTVDGADSDGDIIRAGQDAFYGNDATINSDADGHVGFNFSKLDSNSTPLSDQTQSFSTMPWDCVRDNVTGLVWEVKQASALRDKTSDYTWYNSTGTNDGGLTGTSNGGSCASGSGCDVEKFVADVNASNGGAGICGATDWRLPTMGELASIVNNNTTSPAIDSNFFPNTMVGNFWTSSPDAKSSSQAWRVNFFDGSLVGAAKFSGLYVRLVRSNN